MTMPTDDQVRAAAVRMYESEGEREIDFGATISRADDNSDQGAYVQAWVWVPDSEALKEPTS